MREYLKPYIANPLLAGVGPGIKAFTLYDERPICTPSSPVAGRETGWGALNRYSTSTLGAGSVFPASAAVATPARAAIMKKMRARINSASPYASPECISLPIVPVPPPFDKYAIY